MERETIESQLFTWDQWDEHGPSDLCFYNAVLKVQIGEFPAGTKFPVITMLGSQSLLCLTGEDDRERCFELKISVGEKVDLPAVSADEDPPNEEP